MSNEIKAGEFCWNELISSDIYSVKTFYSKLFGWEFQDNDIGHMTYTMIKNNGKDVGGMMPVPAGKEQQIPSHWLSYICVDDLDSMVGKARSLGADIKQDVMNVGDFGRLAILADPSGAHIALWQSLKSC